MEPFESGVKVSKLGKNYILGIVISLLGFIVLPVMIQFIIQLILTSANPDGLALAIQQAKEIQAGTLTNYKDIATETVVLETLPTTLGEVIAMIPIIIIYFSTFKDDAIRYKKSWKRNLLITVIGSVLLIGVSLLFNLIYEKLNITGDSSNNILVQASIYHYPYLMIPAVIIMIPIFEEFVFRKCLFAIIIDKCKLNHWVAIIVATLVFALCHATNVYFFYYLPLCFCLAFTYDLSRRNIWVSGGIHLSNNIIALVEMLI